MKTWHKGMIIGGAALAVLVPAGLVAADQIGPMGNGQGRGNGSMTQHCTQEQRQQHQQAMQSGQQMQPRHANGGRMGNQNGTTTTVGG